MDTEDTSPAAQQETPTDAGPWLKEIDRSTQYFEKYQDKCDNIDDLYADLEALADSDGDRELQIFWANLEVLKPSVYARPPVPVVAPKWKDMKELPRKASEILERTLVSSFDLEDIDATMRLLRDDFVINGRGSPWIRYEAAGGEENYFAEKVCIEHLDRCDFLHQISRKWKEVGWVARGAWLTPTQMNERFQVREKGYNIQYTEKTMGDDDEENGVKKARVWEIWSKDDRKVYFVTPGVEECLDVQDPWLDLEGFYPCPRPAYGTLKRRTLLPVPDFVYYKDQLEEINELTARISALAESLRMKGLVPGGGDVADAIDLAMKDLDNRALLIPVKNYAALGAAALKDSIVWLPIEKVAQVIRELVELRRQMIDDVYQVTGLSDIIRGATDPNETLGAQQLKSQWGSVRIRDRQAELVRLARDIGRIAGEIIAENFQPQTFMEMAQPDIKTRQQVAQEIQMIQQQAQEVALSQQGQQMAAENPEMAQQAIQQVQQQIQELEQTITLEDVVQLLRDQKMRTFVLDIETDSTIQPDEDADKQRRTEFLAALSNALSQLSVLVSQQPQAAEFAGEVLKFAVAPFRAGRALEGAIDSFVEDMKKIASEPQENPDKARNEAETRLKMAALEVSQMDAETRRMTAQSKAEETQAKMRDDMERTRTELQQAQADLQKTGAEVAKIMAEIEKIQVETTRANEPQEAMEDGRT
jgi:hypothetical protein